MEFNVEMLKCLLSFTECNIKSLVDNVIADSKTDPHYSAVATANRIKCYIQIMSELGEEVPYNSVKEFFSFNNYTNEEYMVFEDHRKKESRYYRGVQY